MSAAFLRLVVLPELTEYFQTPPIHHRREWHKLSRNADAQLGVHEYFFRRIVRKLWVTRLLVPYAYALVALGDIVNGRGAVVHPARAVSHDPSECQAYFSFFFSLLASPDLRPAMR